MDEVTSAAVTKTVDTVSNVGQGVVTQTKSMFHLDELSAYFTWGNLMKVITSVIAIVIFFIVYKIIKHLIIKRGKQKFQPHTVMILGKAMSYVFWIIIAMYVLSLFGIQLSAVWGAAGIAGLAVGFAAQTSVSNIISGIFVLSEKSMRVGDFISVGGESGVVDSVGLLSVKIHTADNQLVRIPNSTIINSNLQNFNTFPTRRVVFEIPISYDADLAKAIVAIKKVPKACPTVLKDPAPAVFYDGFGDCGMTLKLAVWFKSSDLIQTKNDVYINILKICDEEHIDIPYTRYDVKIVDDDATSKIKKVAKKNIKK
jgi:small-conductance mechanosensitive channel